MSAIPWKPEPGFSIVSITSRDDEPGTISIGEPGLTTVRPCRHCGVLLAGGPTACVACVRADEWRGLGLFGRLLFVVRGHR